MIPKTSAGPAEDFTRFARAWFKLLAAGEWDRAFGQLDLPPRDGDPYTPDRFRREVEADHFGPGTRFARAHPEGVIYSDPDAVPGDGRPHVFDRGAPDVYEFEHDVPLNGEWSDLTAGFEFIPAGDHYQVRLDWLHVL
jgi:hypothetical protein